MKNINWKKLLVYLLQIVNTAKLVKLMMNFVEDQGFVIICSIVLNNIIHCNRK